ncbi:hypothetical protein BAUCODRAFT_57151, partial [Baudoinia panamericana UAMH 10762]
DGESGVLTLPDGRHLGCVTYGAEKGHPIFYLHGYPGSRLGASVWHDTARSMGVSIFSMDRPGIGLSDPQPNRSFLSHAHDIKVLAKYLGYEKYHVIGTSGGGPYALACAHSHSPSHLLSTTIISGVGQAGVGTHAMSRGSRLGFWALENAPWAIRVMGELWKWLVENPRLTDDRILNFMRHRQKQLVVPQADRDVFADEAMMRMLLASWRQHFRQGTDAFLQDGRLYTQPMGFDVAQIRGPVRLWYGKLDVNVPAVIGEDYERILKSAGGDVKLHLEHETHLSLGMNCRRRVLEDLLL